MLKKLFVFIFILIQTVASANDLSINIMYEPYRGQPLVVSLSSLKNADYFTVTWQDKTLEVPASYEDERDGCFA